MTRELSDDAKSLCNELWGNTAFRNLIEEICACTKDLYVEQLVLAGEQGKTIDSARLAGILYAIDSFPSLFSTPAKNYATRLKKQMAGIQPG